MIENMQQVTTTEPTQAELERLDAEALKILRSAARRRPRNWIGAYAATGAVVRKARTIHQLARHKNLRGRAYTNYLWQLAGERLEFMADANLIFKEPGKKSWMWGYAVPMPSADITPSDRRFLADLRISWDAPSA